MYLLGQQVNSFGLSTSAERFAAISRLKFSFTLLTLEQGLIFIFISLFLYAAKGYDNYEQIIMGLAGHIAIWPPNHL